MIWETLWYGPRTFWLSVLMVCLVPLSWVYSALVRLWHAQFDWGLRRPIRVEGATVVSVGNLVAGGAGKTPVVMYLATLAQGRGARVAVLSRGYGRRSKAVVHFSAAALPALDEVGDEPRLIARACPGVEVWVGADRVHCARSAVAAGATVLILDDGFQHRRLFRDVDILIDGGEGNGWVLPAGPLREPSAGRRRATLIWGRDGRPGDVESRYVVESVRCPNGKVVELASLAGRAVVVLTAVARPQRVRKTVEDAGARVVALRAFPDHHAFTAEELRQVKAHAAEHMAVLVTTEKDAERLVVEKMHVLVQRVEVTKGAERLRSLGAG